MSDILKNIDFSRHSLIPAIIQDKNTGIVLMLGYMNKEALQKTIKIGRVTFYSRKRARLWTKGEESGNFLNVIEILPDCDNDTILVFVNPAGVVCHTGEDTCFGMPNKKAFLNELEDIIRERRDRPVENSYCSRLLLGKIENISRKIGEEATEVVIESVRHGNRERFVEESADLFFHLLLLLWKKRESFSSVLKVLEKRRLLSMKKRDS